MTELVEHTYADDLESLFYVFIFICIEYQGPLGMKRTLSGSTSWLPREWSASTFKECCQTKTLFFRQLADGKRLDSQIHPYFQDLIPLARDWYLLMRSNDEDPVRFDDVIDILDKHYNNLPKDEPSPELLFAKASLKRKQPTLDADDDLGGARDAGELPRGATQRRLLAATAKNMTSKPVPLAKRGKTIGTTTT